MGEGSNASSRQTYGTSSEAALDQIFQALEYEWLAEQAGETKLMRSGFQRLDLVGRQPRDRNRTSVLTQDPLNRPAVANGHFKVEKYQIEPGLAPAFDDSRRQVSCVAGRGDERPV